MNYVISIFLGMFLFGTFIEGFSFIKNIGLYGAVLFFIIQLFKSKNSSYKLYYENNKLLLNTFFIFMSIVFLSVLFSYFNIKSSLREFRVEFLNIGIFMFISLFIPNKKILFKIFFYSLILAFIYNTVRYGLNYYYVNPHLDFSIRLQRNYSNYFDFLYPFVLAGMFIIKNKFKYLIGVVLFLGFFELILTGARGAWVAVLGESLIFIFLTVVFKKEYLKNILIFSGLSIFLIVISGYYLYNHSSLIKSKIQQGIKPDGRENIIKTRLPIFLKYGNYIIGIGGPGDIQYIKFLNKYHVPKQYGEQCKNYFKYWGDEPFLLQTFYKQGILGLVIFLFFSALFLYQIYKYINLDFSKEAKFFILAVMSSYIGYYFIRGLVEGRTFKYVLIFLTLYLITKEMKNENSISIS